MQRFHSDPFKPFAQNCCNELRAIVTTNVFRRPMPNEKLSQCVEDIPRVQLSLDPDGEAFPCKLVDHTQHTERMSIMGVVLHEVIRPDMAFMRWPKPNARIAI